MAINASPSSAGSNGAWCDGLLGLLARAGISPKSAQLNLFLYSLLWLLRTLNFTEPHWHNFLVEILRFIERRQLCNRHNDV